MLSKKIKAWMKEDSSQLSIENGMFIMLIILLIIGVAAIISPGLKNGFDNIMATFQASAATNG